MTDRVVLAYSGGLDTSVGIGWIAEETGAEVVAVAVDVGQGGEDLESIRKRALACGAVEAVVADARDEFAEQYCLPALQAHALYMDRYPLVSALSRPLIVKHLVEAAKRYGAHDRGARLHRQGQRPGPVRGRHPGARARAEVIAPVRDFAWTREKAIQYAEDHDCRSRPASGRRTRSTRTSGAARWRPGSWRTSGTRRSKTSTPTPQIPPSAPRARRGRRPVREGGTGRRSTGTPSRCCRRSRS